MDGDCDLIADFDPRQIHQGGVKDDAVGISHLRNCFRHDVILCFTRFIGKKKYLRRKRQRDRLAASKELGAGSAAVRAGLPDHGLYITERSFPSFELRTSSFCA